jgi:hypothetical protein
MNKIPQMSRFLHFILLFVVADLFAQDLPPGVPRSINPDGTVSIQPMFTTKAFQDEAQKLVIQEANRVAKELNLPEKLPITQADVVHSYVGPFEYTYTKKKVGNITTANFWYGVEQGYKFSNLAVANYDQTCLELKDLGKIPASRMDTNAAYQLSKQWLSKLHVDINRLNQNCELKVEISEFWNGLASGEKFTAKEFVPIYDVTWVPRHNDLLLGGGTAVQLYLPTKKIIQISINDPQYILRQPIVFTNLAALFPGKAQILTNEVIKPKIGHNPGLD